MRLRFGKHRGKELGDVPEDYKYWLLDASRTLILELEDDLHETHANGNGVHHSTPDLPPLTLELVEAGFRSLSKRHHPDLNGGRPSEKMIELNRAIAQLRKALK